MSECKVDAAMLYALTTHIPSHPTLAHIPLPSPYVYSFGAFEHLDVIAGMEWLTATHGIPSTRIGISGASMGGAAVLVAAALDPRFKAVWADSPACDVLQVTNLLYFI